MISVPGALAKESVVEAGRVSLSGERAEKRIINACQSRSARNIRTTAAARSHADKSISHARRIAGSGFRAKEGIVAAGRRPNAKERITSRSIVKTGVAAEKRVAAARHIASPGIRSEEGVVKARRITPASKTAEERIETLGVDWTRPETHKSAFVRIVRAQNPLTAEIVLCLRIDDVCRECAADS